MAHIAEGVLELVGLLHDGLADDAVWMRALDRVCDLLDSPHLYLASVDSDNRPFSLFGHRTAPAAIDILAGRLGNQVDNPWVRAAIKQPLRRPITIDNIGGQHALERTRVWHELYVPYDISDALGIVLERQPENADMLIALRRNGAARFDAEAAAKLAMVAPHVARAWRVKRTLAQWVDQVRTLSGVLDRLDRAVVVTDDAGTIRFANRAAERLLSTGDGIDATNGRIRANQSRDTDALHEAISRVSATAIGEGMAATDAVSIVRAQAEVPLAIIAEPLSASHGAKLGQASRPGALLFIGDSVATTCPSPDRLRIVYGLTRAEARLTALIVEGRALADAAASLGVSENTAKFHMKSVFGKIGVSRQAQLMRRVLADVGGLAEPEALRPR